MRGTPYVIILPHQLLEGFRDGPFLGCPNVFLILDNVQVWVYSILGPNKYNFYQYTNSCNSVGGKLLWK
jgi:hypothetical protein